MPKSFLTDAQRWRCRAEEMRSLGENMREPASKRVLFRLATDYDVMAERAERQNVTRDPPAPPRHA